jgi:hypothetical protein
MKLIDKLIEGHGRADEFSIHPLGDVHCGAKNCAEKALNKEVKKIYQDPNAYWFSGGDLLEAIAPHDKRFDFSILPKWMLENDAEDTAEALNDIIRQQKQRICAILQPIKNKCLGLLEGNHEYAIRKNSNRNIHKEICEELECVNLTDETMMRLRFRRLKGYVVVVVVYARHGYGSGRTDGAEPLKLGRMLAEWEDADICFSGNTHTFHIMPPKPVLSIPRSGRLPDELYQRYRWAANWGCWQYSHSVGPSTYPSRQCFPARAMLTTKAVIQPFHKEYRQKNGKTTEIPSPLIEVRAITL